MENLKIYLGASLAGLCTIKGTVTLPQPPFGQNLGISPLSPSLLGAAGDPTALLAQLQNGYRVFTNNTDKDYPYVITDLKPGAYVPVPVLTGFGNGALAMNFLVNLFQTVNLAAGETGTANFKFGPVNLSGTVTFKPVAPPKGFVYGIVAAKSVSLTGGLQAVLMPTVFLPVAQPPGGLSGNYAGEGLRENANFAVRVFTSAEAGNPLLGALQWVINPFAPQLPHLTLPTGSTNLQQDIALP